MMTKMMNKLFINKTNFLFYITPLLHKAIQHLHVAHIAELATYTERLTRFLK